MKRLNLTKPSTIIIFFMLILYSALIQGQPTFLADNDPKPDNMNWVKIENLSDEFNDGNLNGAKWNSNPQIDLTGGTSGVFLGNAPGIFEQGNVQETNQHLTILAERFNSPKMVAGESRSYGGGKVDSRNILRPGYYMEARMKANQTIMSSAFWLLPNETCQQLGNQRRQEIDIQECIGRTNAQTPFWARFWNKIFHSNAIALEGCGNSRDQKQGVTNLQQENSQSFRIYGCWWKSPNELLFYLDGVYQYTIVPGVPFTQNMHYRLSSNLYAWQGTTDPETDGFNLARDNRLTKFDWVRTWQLNDAPQDEVSFVSTPTSLAQSQSYSFDLNYTATANRTMGIGIFKGGTWIRSGSVNVPQGSGTKTVNVNLNSLPALGNNYSIQAWVRPQGGTSANDLDREFANNVSIVNTSQDEISFVTRPTSLSQSQSYSFNLNYTATQPRLIGIGIFKGGTWIRSGSVNVPQGSGTKTVNVNFNNLPATGNNYSIQAWIRPQGGTLANDLDRKFANNVSINSGNKLYTDEGVIVEAYPNPLGTNEQLFVNVLMPENNDDVEIAVFDIQGKQVYSNRGHLPQEGNTYRLDAATVFKDQRGVYILRVTSSTYRKTIKIVR